MQPDDVEGLRELVHRIECIATELRGHCGSDEDILAWHSKDTDAQAILELPHSPIFHGGVQVAAAVFHELGDTVEAMVAVIDPAGWAAHLWEVAEDNCIDDSRGLYHYLRGFSNGVVQRHPSA
jgi:hypothetical protein